MNHLIDNFDFGSIGHGTIVDVGGSHGQVSIGIARRYPQVKCIVQDLPKTSAGLESRLPEDLKSRISGMEHDFMTHQPVKGADIYLLRWILHDWSDKYCVKILQCLVPALKKGAKIVVNDICIPQPGQLGIAADRSLRSVHLSISHVYYCPYPMSITVYVIITVNPCYCKLKSFQAHGYLDEGLQQCPRAGP